MGEYWQVMGRYDAETQAFSAFTTYTGGPASPFVPVEAQSTLVGIRAIVGSQAATSLTEGVAIKLTCTAWKPNTLTFYVQGNGLRTAPAAAPPVYDFPVNQPCSSNSPITLEGMCLEATHVTNSVLIMGKFKS